MNLPSGRPARKPLPAVSRKYPQAIGKFLAKTSAAYGQARDWRNRSQRIVFPWILQVSYQPLVIKILSFSSGQQASNREVSVTETEVQTSARESRDSNTLEGWLSSWRSGFLPRTAMGTSTTCKSSNPQLSNHRNTSS